MKISKVVLAMLGLGMSASTYAQIETLQPQSLVGNVPGQMGKVKSDDLAYLISWGGDVPTILTADPQLHCCSEV